MFKWERGKKLGGDIKELDFHFMCNITLCLLVNCYVYLCSLTISRLHRIGISKLQAAPKRR